MKRKHKILVICILIIFVLSVIFIVNIQKNNTDKIASTDKEQAKTYTEITTNSEWNYYVNEDNTTITITIYKGTATEITIPSTLDGKTVTGLEGILWTPSVSNKEIQTIRIPSGINSIKPGHSFNENVIKNIIVDENNQNYASVDGVLFNKQLTELVYYPQAKESTTYEIPSSVKTIKESAFHSCNNLTSISMPSGLTTIEKDAFDSCASLENIDIPNSVTSIGIGAFKNCTSLAEVTLPSNVEEIKNATFYNCTSLTNITIPSGVKRLELTAFQGCTNLEFIEILDEIEYTEYRTSLWYIYCK